MINAAPSLFKPYDEFWSGDPAIVQSPEPPDDGASDAATKAYADELAAYNTRIRLARETGDWSGILVEGQKPTRFKMRPLNAEIVSALRDYTIGGTSEHHNLMALVWIRCALEAVVGLPDPETGIDYKVVRELDQRFPHLGKIARPHVTNAIYQLRVDGELIGPEIIGELYGVLVMRAHGGLSPKS